LRTALVVAIAVSLTVLHYTMILRGEASVLTVAGTRTRRTTAVRRGGAHGAGDAAIVAPLLSIVSTLRLRRVEQVSLLLIVSVGCMSIMELKKFHRG
jgi:hypothetical protein